jgi:hypothetical protein
MRASKPTSPAYCIAAIVFTCVFELSLRRFALCGLVEHGHGWWRLAVKWLTDEKNLLEHQRKRVRLVRWNRSARSVVNGARQWDDVVFAG